MLTGTIVTACLPWLRLWFCLDYVHIIEFEHGWIIDLNDFVSLHDRRDFQMVCICCVILCCYSEKLASNNLHKNTLCMKVSHTVNGLKL